MSRTCARCGTVVCNEDYILMGNIVCENCLIEYVKRLIDIKQDFFGNGSNNRSEKLLDVKEVAIGDKNGEKQLDPKRLLDMRKRQDNGESLTKEDYDYLGHGCYEYDSCEDCPYKLTCPDYDICICHEYESGSCDECHVKNECDLYTVEDDIKNKTKSELKNIKEEILSKGIVFDDEDDDEGDDEGDEDNNNEENNDVKPITNIDIKDNIDKDETWYYSLDDGLERLQSMVLNEFDKFYNEEDEVKASINYNPDLGKMSEEEMLRLYRITNGEDEE